MSYSTPKSAVDYYRPLAFDPQEIQKLVQAEDYNKLAILLTKAQPKYVTNDDIALTIVTAAQIICQGALQIQQDVALYQQAQIQALQRLQDSRELLSKIADLALSIEQIRHEPRSPVDAPQPFNPLHFLRSLLRNGQPNTLPSKLLSLPETPPAERMPRLMVYCLGGFKFYRDRQLLRDWRSNKGLAVLKYLLINRTNRINKDVLGDMFWPESDPGAARRSLHQAVYSVRRFLKQDDGDCQLLLFEDECYFIDSNIAIWIDHEEFMRRAKTGIDLEHKGFLAEALVEYTIAEGLYQGGFLEEDVNEGWTLLKRQQLRDTYLELADRLSEHYLQQGEYTAAMALCRKIISVDNCLEGAYRRLMRCYVALGQRQLAIRQYLTCLEVLKEELNLVPSPETVSLYQRLVEA